LKPPLGRFPIRWKSSDRKEPPQIQIRGQFPLFVIDPIPNRNCPLGVDSSFIYRSQMWICGEFDEAEIRFGEFIVARRRGGMFERAEEAFDAVTCGVQSAVIIGVGACVGAVAGTGARPGQG
jgi:hypothetical protein